MRDDTIADPLGGNCLRLENNEVIKFGITECKNCRFISHTESLGRSIILTKFLHATQNIERQLKFS